MRLIQDWQYKYVEKCLYNYKTLDRSHLPTEKLMKKAITDALSFFKGNPHEGMMLEFYFNADAHRRSKTNGGHFNWVCRDLLFMEPGNGWVVRREIIYRVSMNCYALGVFKLK